MLANPETNFTWTSNRSLRGKVYNICLTFNSDELILDVDELEGIIHQCIAIKNKWAWPLSYSVAQIAERAKEKG